MEEPQVYVGLDDPVSIRRQLLESLKANIHCLQQGEKLKQIRHTKRAEISRFREITSELYAMMAELRKDIPRVRVKKTKAQKAVHQLKQPIKHVSELDALENDLKKIESKLDQLQ